MALTKAKIQMRRDTTANWQNDNPTLLVGEIGYDTTLKSIKIGDGASDWDTLNYVEGVPAVGGNVDSSSNDGILFTGAGKLQQDSTLSFNKITKVFKLLDSAFVGLFGAPVTRFFNIGTSTRITVPTGNYMVAEEVNLPLTLSGTNKYYIGKRASINVQGTTSGCGVIGHWVDIFSNASYPTGNSTLWGVYSSVDVGGAYQDATAGRFELIAGGSGASGAGKFSAIVGAIIPAHNGNTTEAFAGEFEITSALSSPSVVGTVSGTRVKVTVRDGNTFNDLRGMSLCQWSKTAGGAVDISYGIYADASIDIGTESHFLYSLSTSPSKLSGDLTIDGAGKLFIANSQTPASSSATGTKGQIAWDSSYVYVCTATNTWKRTSLSTW